LVEQRVARSASQAPPGRSHCCRLHWRVLCACAHTGENISSALPFNRVKPDGSQQYFRASGEPIFDRSARFIGYRGIGVEVAGRLLSIVPEGTA